MRNPDTSRVVAPRFPWERDPDPLIQELDDERAALLCELGIEADLALMSLFRDLIFALEREIETLRKIGDGAKEKARAKMRADREAWSEPIISCFPHCFSAVTGNPFCGECGGGQLHPIHKREEWRSA